MPHSRGERNARWIEKHCRIPEGRDVGKKVELREWQRAELYRIYDNEAGTRRAILSFGRKNAKTSLAAFILLLHLCGPEAKPNSQLYSAAQSRDQAAILFSLAAKMVRMSPVLSDVVTVRDTAKQLFCRELGTLYRALSAEVATSYGLSPSLIVHDELGQVEGARSELYEALETATGAQEAPLSIIISTQAPNDRSLLSVLIDDAVKGYDPRVVVSLHTAPKDLDPFAEATIRLANPAFGDFLNRDEVMAMAEDARRMPSREATYRNLVLNQRVEASNPFVAYDTWNKCAAPPKPITGKSIPVYGGLDLSEVNDLTALVLIGQVDDVWQVHPTFWLPHDGIAERSRLDRVPYDMWWKQGYLIAAPGKTVDYEYVAHHLFDVFKRHNIRKLAFDRWNFEHLKPWLFKVGFSEATIADRFVEFIQGYKSMHPALNALEGHILNGRLAHGAHPVLAMCAANAVVSRDPNNWRKLVKNKSTRRIDGLVALTMAAGVAGTGQEQPKRHRIAFV